MNPAIDEIGAEEIRKQPVDGLLAQLMTTTASLDATEVRSGGGRIVGADGRRRELPSGQVVEPKGTPAFEIGAPPPTSSLVSPDFPAASVGAAHLRTLVLGKLCAVIRRLGRIQSE